MTFDRVAIPCSDVAQSIEWYETNFRATVLERGPSSAVLNVGGMKVALVNPHQQPPHITLNVSAGKLLEISSRTGVKIDDRADGNRALFIHDPFGNAVELICPPTPAPASSEDDFRSEGAPPGTQMDFIK